jgi:hypothetical protein
MGVCSFPLYMFSMVLVFLSGSFSNIKFIAKLPANPPLKDTWKESVFSLTAGVEDRLVASHHHHHHPFLLVFITCYYDYANEGPIFQQRKCRIRNCCLERASDSYVFWPLGSGFISQRTGSFYHYSEILRKTLIPTFLS